MSKNRLTMLNAWLFPLCLVVAWCMTACSDDDAVVQQHDTKMLKVAVLMGEEEQERWKRTARWALENIADAQQGMPNRVELQLEFYNQDAEDIENRMKQIAEDTTIVAVVGPTTSTCATLMAQRLNVKKAYQKPMITPSATQTEYQRKFANTAFVWNMAESNIAQLEVLIAGIASNVTEEPVSLLTADESNDYEEWFGFIAEEYGLKVDGIYLYNTADDVRRYVRRLCGTD
ncbi:ABC transporter substrate-binding protein, partial [Bacteroides heparinolyticus]